MASQDPNELNEGSWLQYQFMTSFIHPTKMADLRNCIVNNVKWK